MIHALAFSAAANLLAAEQILDCATTKAIVSQPLGVEINPIARKMNPHGSLGICLLEAATINLAIRVSGSKTLLHVAVGIEGLAVAHNFQQLGRTAPDDDPGRLGMYARHPSTVHLTVTLGVGR